MYKVFSCGSSLSNFYPVESLFNLQFLPASDVLDIFNDKNNSNQLRQIRPLVVRLLVITKISLWTPVSMTIQMLSSEMIFTDIDESQLYKVLFDVGSNFRPDIPLEDLVCCSGCDKTFCCYG